MDLTTNSMTAEELAAYFENKRANEPVITQSAQPVEQQQAAQAVQGQENEEQEAVEQTVESQEQKPESEQSTEEAVQEPEFSDDVYQRLFTDDLLSPFVDENSQPIVPKSWDEVAELIKANKQGWIEEARTNDKESLLQEIFDSTSPAFKFIAQNANKFTSPDELIPLLTSVQSQDAVAQLDGESQEGQEQIIRISLSLQGLDPQSIEEEITDLKDRDKLEARAKKLKPSLDDYFDKKTQSILAEQAEKNQQNQIFWNNYYGKLRTDLIDAKEVGGMNISREHKTLIAGSLVPDQKTGNLPIYDIIDKLVGSGDINKLAKIALIASDETLFDSYYGSKKAAQAAKTLQRTLRSNVVSNTSQEVTQEQQKQKPKSVQDTGGYGIFVKRD